MKQEWCRSGWAQPIGAVLLPGGMRKDAGFAVPAPAGDV